MKGRRLLAACILASVASVLISAYLHSSSSSYWIYSDIYSFWFRNWVSAGQAPFTQGAFFEYPPVSGFALYAARILGGLFANAAGGLYAGYYDWFSILSLGAAAVMAWSTYRLAKALGRDLNPLYFFLPSMIVYGFYNFDLFNALFVVLSLQYFVEKRRGWSGAFLGIAIATKLVGVVLLPIFLLELGNRKERLNYLAVSLLTAFAFLVPVLLYNFGYVSQFLSYFSNWGLEDAWYIWIFGHPFSYPAKLFGYGLMALLLLRVYTLRMPLVQRSFLALAAYLLGTYIYAPQFNLVLVPLLAVLAVTSPWMFATEVFNALIILTWFIQPSMVLGGLCPDGTTWCPTWPGTYPQTMALLRGASLGALALSVASASGHSLAGWFRSRLNPQGKLDGYADRQVSNARASRDKIMTSKDPTSRHKRSGRGVSLPEAYGWHPTD